jgi:hypothetical protein
MGLMKINKILKKYKQLHKNHVESWEEAQKRIRAATENGGFPDETYKYESYNYHLKGNKLFDSLMKELEGHEIFPKKVDKNL